MSEKSERKLSFLIDLLYTQNYTTVYTVNKRASFILMKNVCFMTLTALLTAIAIFIPIAMPLKIGDSTSLTHFSHVAIFIAMFINPWMAIFVVLSSYGFSLFLGRIHSLSYSARCIFFATHFGAFPTKIS